MRKTRCVEVVRNRTLTQNLMKHVICVVAIALFFQSGSAAGGIITQNLNTLTPNQLAEFLVSGIPGTTVLSVTTNTTAGAMGLYQGGVSAGIGIDEGFVMSTGDIASAQGPNLGENTTTVNNTSGDPDLDTLIPVNTFDSASLTIDFSVAGLGPAEQLQIAFEIVFASEEYDESVGMDFEDVMGIFLSDSNFATVPGAGVPITTNTINGVTNAALFNSNDPTPGPAPFDLEYDGFTNVLTATVLITGGGPHQLKFAIADGSDTAHDTAAFIRPVVREVPEPSPLLLLCLGLVFVVWHRLQTGSVVSRLKGQAHDLGETNSLNVSNPWSSARG